MPATKQIPDGIDLPEGWVCETHTRRCDALVIFLPSVVRVFADYDSRHALTGAAGDEINAILSSDIPYGTFDFKEMLFVYSAFWSDLGDCWAIEIDLAAEMKVVGYISKI